MSSNPTRVLIVQSNSKEREDLRKILSATERACQVSYAEQLEDALAQLEKFKPDVAMLDLELSDSPAFFTFQRFREKAPSVPVVIMTDGDGETYALKAVQEGAEKYLIKGRFDAKIVEQALCHAMDKFGVKSVLEGQRREYQAALDAVYDGVLLLDREGKIVSMNKAAVTLTGYDFPELKGKSEHEKLHFRKANGLEYPIKECIVHETLQNGREHQRSEDILWRRDRTSISVEIRCIPLKQGDAIDGAVLAIHDLTEMKKAADRKREADEIKAHFISIVSHELRTPLTSIKEGIGLVLEEKAGSLNSEQKDFLGTAEQNVERLRRVVEDLLKIQEMYSDRMRFEFKDHDIGELINDALASVRPSAQSKNVQLSVELDRQIPAFSFDKEKIKHVFLSLLRNAITYTDQGSVTIRSLLRESVVEVSVADTGRGIKEEDLNRLFNSFGQLEDTDNRKTGGTGLGLAMAKKILERHGGTIWVKSDWGKGSTFSIILPLNARKA